MSLEPVMQLLRRVRRRLRTAWALETLQLAAPVVAVVALVLVGVGWITPWAWTEPAAIGLAVVTVIAVGGFAVFARISDRTAAQAADTGLETRDAFTTALEVPEDAEPFGSLVRRRAVTLADHANARSAVRYRAHPSRVLTAAAVAPCALALALLTSPQDEKREDQARLDAVTDDVAARLDAEAGKLRDDPAGASAAAQLEELADELRRADDLTEASELARTAADELAPDPDLLGTKAAVQGLDHNVANEPLPGSDAGMSAREQLAAAASAASSMTEEERQELAQRLEALADTQVEGDPATAEALEQAASELRSGDVGAASASLGEAAAAHEQAAGTVAAGDASSGAADAARRASSQLSGQGTGSDQSADGEGEGSGEAQGQSGGQGNGDGQGEGQGQGSGDGQGQTNGGSPSGDVAGGSGGQGPVSGQGGQGQGAGSNEGDPTGDGPELDTIFDPVTGGDGEEVVAGGGDGAGAGGTIGTSDGPTNAGTSRVPLDEAITTYEQRATEALDQAAVPPRVRDLVVSYYDRLQGRD